MSISIEELRALRKRTAARDASGREIAALSGDGSGNLYYGTNQMYARRKDTRAIVVVWGRVSQPDLDIILKMDRNDQLYVERADLSNADATFGAAASAAELPPMNGDALPFMVPEKRIEPGAGLASSTGGLTVKIRPFWYARGSYWSDDTDITLVPTTTSNKKAWVLWGVNRVTGAAAQALTADRALDYTMDVADCTAVIRANPNVEWCAAVPLRFDATTINASAITSIRHFVASAPPGEGYATVSTTTTTVTTLASITVSEGELIAVRGQVIGAKSDYSAGVAQTFEAAARRASGGNVTLIGTPAFGTLFEDATGTPAITIDADTGTQTVRVRVQAGAAESWSWYTTYQVRSSI